MPFSNVYEDAKRAEAYDKLEFPGTYYLAYRDLPEIFLRHVRGEMVLDFGCGAGRSTRFLKQIGFDAIGIDISEDMLKRAHHRDPEGIYLLAEDNGSLDVLAESHFDLIFSAFTFDNIPTAKHKLSLLKTLQSHLNPSGRIVNLVSSPDIYTHEWASFTTKDFPENKLAKSGDEVKIVMTDVEDSRPVLDVMWSDEAYRELYQQAGLSVIEKISPLGKPEETFAWKSETTVAPWTIYVLGI